MKRIVVLAAVTAVGVMGSTPSIAEGYVLGAPSDPILNSADRDLKSVRSWHYVMGAGDLDVFARRDWPIQALDASQYPYEMMVTELRSGPAADKEHWTDAFLSADNIRAWQNSTSEGKIFLAYVALSGLSTSHYFNGVAMSARAGWIDAKGNPTASAPWWVLCPVGDYPGLNKVAFWAPEWKKHVLTEVDYAITVGANGVFLDEFDGTAYRLRNDPACASLLPAGLDLEREMITFLQEIRTYIESRSLGRPFWIVVADGRDTLKKYPAFLTLVDGALSEHAFFVGWSLPDFMNGPEQDWRTTESIAFVKALAAAGLPVFTLDYITDPAKIARVAELASAARIIPAVSEQKLLILSKIRNVLWCDKSQCRNNGAALTNRHLTIPVEETFFDLLESTFPAFFRPAWRSTQRLADERGEFVYRYYRETGKYVGYRVVDRAAFYYDPVSGTIVVQGTIESWVKELSAP